MANTPRACACKPGCTEIAKSNASPYAKGHNPNKKRASSQRKAKKPARPVLRRASPHRNCISTPRVSIGVATICVTETNLDNFWAKLSLEEKAALYQQQLESA